MKNKAAQALGSMKSPAKTKAARANGKLGGRPAYVKCALFRAEADDDDGNNVWWLGTLHDHNILPCIGGFPTASAARSEAARRGWKPIRKPAMDTE